MIGMIELLMGPIDYYSQNTRLINFVLLFLVIVGFSATIISRRSKAIRRVRRITMWVYLIFLNFSYGTADNIHDHIRVNPPVIISTFLLLGLLLSIIWKPEGDDCLPPDDGAMGSRFAAWLDTKVLAYKARRLARLSDPRDTDGHG